IALRAERRPLERVDGDVHFVPLAGTDLLAAVEHRRLVLIALPDDDDAGHVRRPSMWRMPSTAAWSAEILSPRPIQRQAPRAADSVTRTSSSARLRSGARPEVPAGAPVSAACV